MKKELLLNMLDAQFKLNTKTSGAKWILGVTNKDKLINWPRTIFLELAELIESYPYKHWKNIEGGADILNAKIELVDTWHFIMSLSIEYTFYKFLEHIQETEKDFKLENLTEDQVQLFWDTPVKEATVDFILSAIEAETSQNVYRTVLDKKTENMTELNAKLATYEDLMLNALMLSSLNLYRTDKESYTSSVVSILGIFNLIVTEIEPFDLEKIYYGKLILNTFRQDNGYKEGTYQKIWINEAGEKVEDNRIMFKLLEDECPIEELESKLTEAYKKES